MSFRISITKELPEQGIFVYREYKDKYIVLDEFELDPEVPIDNVNFTEFNKGLTQLFTPLLNAIEKRVNEFLLRPYIKDNL